jgi:hypothetical protein
VPDRNNQELVLKARQLYGGHDLVMILAEALERMDARCKDLEKELEAQRREVDHQAAIRGATLRR